MSVTLKKDSWKIKGGNGTYRDSAIFSTTLPEDAAAIVAEATSAIDAQQIRATDIVDAATSEIDTIVQRVNDLVDTGTDTTLTQAGAAADAKAAGDKIEELKSAVDNKNTEIYNGYESVMLTFANGWINSNGVYNPSATRFLSNVIGTTDLTEVVNGSSSIIYAVYFSTYTSLSDFTYATYSQINTNATHTINTNYPYVAIESAATDRSGLAGILLKKKSIINYLSYDSYEETKSDINNIISISVDDLKFIVGGMDTNGNYQASQKYRIVTSGKITLSIDVRIRLTSTNYRFYLIIYAENGTISKRIGWSNVGCPFTIPKGTAFKLMIARVTEDTSETDNLAEFSSITNIVSLTDFVNNVKQEAVYTGLYTALLRMSGYVDLGSASVGQTVDVSAIQEINGLHCTALLDDVIAGEKYVVTAIDSSTARPWAFFDKDFKLLSMSVSESAVEVEITAPINAKYLLIQIGLAGNNYENGKIARELNLSDINNGSDSATGIVALNIKQILTEKLIETRYCGNNSETNLTLFHFSDIHGSTDNIQRILDLGIEFPDFVDDIIHSGDSVSTYFGNQNPFATVGGNQVLNLIGNHDCWIQGDTWPSPYNATSQQTYEKFIAPFISNWDVISAGVNLCYYYKDYADYGIRLICLDCMHYDSTQESWFTDALNGAKTNNYSVVVVNHYPPQSGVTPFDCTFTSYGKTIPAVSTPPVGTQIERLPESAYTAVDGFITNGGKFICWIAGHTHFDFVGTVTNHENQIVVIVNCGVVDARYGTDKRIIGTKTQDCVNVIAFDTTNKFIKICRVGIAMDWFARSKNLLSIDYANKTVVANS